MKEKSRRYLQKETIRNFGRVGRAGVRAGEFKIWMELD